MTEPHRFRLRVYYEDTDMGGIVYHANYLRFIERARSEWVAALGIDQMSMLAQGQVFAVRAVSAEFLAPARLGDELSVETRLSSLRGASLILAQRVLRGPTMLFSAEVTLVAMSLAGRPTRLPAALRRLAGP